MTKEGWARSHRYYNTFQNVTHNVVTHTLRKAGLKDGFRKNSESKRTRTPDEMPVVWVLVCISVSGLLLVFLYE
jgi:hypothetical protein